jgi:hypothetical protein
MSEEQFQFMRAFGQLPARLSSEQAAWVINCQVHDIPVLLAARLLKPLGNPAANAIKFFSAAELLALAKDKAWLVKVTNAVNHHWQRHNAGKKNDLAKGLTGRRSTCDNMGMAENGRDADNACAGAVFPSSCFAGLNGLNRCGQMRKSET